MAAAELALVAKAWKMDLYERWNDRDTHDLRDKDWWAVCNHVINRITLPSSEPYVGCHPSEPTTPLCWMVVRRTVGLSSYEILYLGARRGLPSKEPELAATLERTLVAAVSQGRVIAADRRPLNLFQELRR